MVCSLWPSWVAMARTDHPALPRVRIFSARSRGSIGGDHTAGGRRGLGGDVGLDGVQGLLGDLLGAVQDGVDGGAADQPEQASDHPVGALMQVAIELGESVWPVPLEPEAFFQGGDQRSPLWILTERAGAD